ncbi:MAG: DUF4339 domain-containing protein [Puniceicoccaceae bacterium]|nr:MAG: DUF4339 domain-containing protein [Puniceicoccaceae bacterium]
MEEFYIRNEGDEEARGPFTMDQLSSLADAGQVNRETFYYDINEEKWIPVGDNEALLTTLFPEKKKLRIKPKENIQSLNAKDQETKPITVHEMLAAAEGRTPETSGKRDPRVLGAKAAFIGMNAAAVILGLSALGFLLPRLGIILSLDFGVMLGNPFLLLGLLDLFLCVGLGLQVSALFPLVRFRAMAGAGFLLVLMTVQGDPLLGLLFALAGLALFFNTLLLRILPVIIASTVGILASLTAALMMIF